MLLLKIPFWVTAIKTQNYESLKLRRNIDAVQSDVRSPLFLICRRLWKLKLD